MPLSRPALVLGPGDAGRPVSAGEFASAEFVEPYLYEREAGRLVVMSPEGQRHADDSRPWRHALNRYWIEHPDIVEDVLQQAWTSVDGGTDRMADIGVYLVPRGPVRPIPERVPELIFEILSPGREAHRRDYVAKRADYYRLGVLEYVVVDRFARAVTVFTRGARGYRRRVLNSAEAYESPLLPGLRVELAEVF